MISLQFLITAFVVVIAPGTGVVYTLAIGLGQGKLPAFWAALGCTLGIVPHLLAATLGLAALLHTSASLFTVVKIMGVAYLLYLAWQALKSDGALAIRPDITCEPAMRITRRGVLINILNPKLSIFFLALLPPFLSGNPATATLEMSLLGGVFMMLTFVTFLFYGLFAATARNWFMGNVTILRWLNRSIAGIFVALAVRLAWDRS